MRAFAPAPRVFMLSVAFMLLGLIGLAFTACAAGPPGSPEEKARQIALAGAALWLDLDDLQRDDATAAEKARFQEDAQRAIELVGLDTETGRTLATLLTEYASGEPIHEPSWRTVVRLLIDWAAGAPPPPASSRGGVSPSSPLFVVLAGRRRE